MQQFKALLLAAEMASRERGPTNGMLGEDAPGDPVKRAMLDGARLQTDLAFEELQQILGPEVTPKTRIRLASDGAFARLQKARAMADALALQARIARKPEDIRETIGQMIEVIEDLAPAAFLLSNEAAASIPEATSALTAARNAAALREYAGQLGSQFTVPLMTGQHLNPAERMAIDRLRGRIEQLRQQLTVGADALEPTSNLHETIGLMQTNFFEGALPYVDAMADVGLQSGQYGVTIPEFIARYVPNMGAIVALRDALLVLALDEARRGVRQSQIVAISTAIGSVVTLGILSMTWWLLHRRVVRRLEMTRRVIVTIANGDYEVRIPRTRLRDEVADVLEAIHVLRDNSIARRNAEDEVRKMAYFDQLTGLPNRRLLEDRMAQLLSIAKRKLTHVSVLFIDLDKFKQVNDVHGHEAGDWLLKEAAARMQSVVRTSDTVARLGGDEFVVLLPDAACADEAMVVAEKIRLHMERPFVMEGGVVLDISASIGIAMFPDQASSAEDLLRFGDEAMYLAKKRGRNAIEVFASA